MFSWNQPSWIMNMSLIIVHKNYYLHNLNQSNKYKIALVPNTVPSSKEYVVTQFIISGYLATKLVWHQGLLVLHFVVKRPSIMKFQMMSGSQAIRGDTP